MRLSWWRGPKKAPNPARSPAVKRLTTTLKSLARKGVPKFRPEPNPAGSGTAQESGPTPRPDAAPTEAPRARRLWGKEFSVASQGLDEVQVAAFVNDLINQHNALLQEYESVKLVRGFSKQLLEDTERQAASLRARAKREAELEAAQTLAEAQQQANQTLAQAKRRAEELAALEVRDLIQTAQQRAEVEVTRILSEAQQQASQTLAQAKRRAEEITAQEARDLIQSAQRRAELVERQAKVVAQKFLLQVRDEVQNQIANEVQAAYYKLLNTVEEVLTAGQGIETEWKSKTYHLMSAAPLELEEYQSHFLDSDGPRLTEGFTPTESVAELGPERPGEAPSPKPTVKELLEPLPVAERYVPTVPEVVGDAMAPTIEAPMPPGRPSPEAPRARLTAATAPKAAPSEEVPASTVMRGSNELEVLRRMAEGRPPGTPQDIPTTVAPLLEGVAAASSMRDGPAVKPPAERRSPPSGAETAPGESAVDRDLAYHGEVDLVMGTSVDFQRVAKFYSHLQTLRGLQILRTTGDWNVGTVVTIVLDTPAPLITLLESIPSIRATPDTRETGAGRGEKRVRIAVTIEGDN